jgi:serine O-acetyltransferase
MLHSDERIRTKEQLHEWLKIELLKYPCSEIGYIFQIGEAAILKRHQLLLRKAEYYLNTGKKTRFLLLKIKLRKLQTKYSLCIPFNCCACGLHIVHLGPVLLNNRVSLGKNCVLHMNTSIVAGGTTDDVPIIGNGVIVGVGAVILGNVEIADNVAIGANAVVNKSVTENNVTVAGVPGRIISRNGSSDWNKKMKQPKFIS